MSDRPTKNRFLAACLRPKPREHFFAIHFHSDPSLIGASFEFETRDPADLARRLRKFAEMITENPAVADSLAGAPKRDEVIS